MSSLIPVSRAFATAVLITSLVACGESVSAPPPPPVDVPRPVAAVEITGALAQLAVNATFTARATLRDAQGNVLEGRTVVWSSTNVAVVSVSQTGHVRAMAPGVATLRAASEGKEASVAVTVVAGTPVVASLTLDATAITLDEAETRRLAATARDADGAPITGVSIAWASNHADVATVSAEGVVTALGIGRATITAVVDGKRAEASVTVLGIADYDLVLDRWDVSGGNIMHSWLHRLDLRTPDAMPAPIFQIAGTSDATTSPDGAKIAFVCESEGPAICVANHDGSGVVLLPAFSQMSGMLGDQPAWSPDGTKIAFRGWMPGGPPGIFNPADIWVMNADGSGKTKITTAAREVDAYESPTWSPRQPDGSYRIAFAHVSRGADGYMRSNIESARADGLDRRPVTQAGAYVDGEPTWSPDGSTIAFVRSGGDVGSDIWLVNATGGSERSLLAADPSSIQRAPAWSPDGRYIAFASNHEIISNFYTYQIYTVRADGTRLTRRTDDRREKGNPAWIRQP